MKRKVFLFGLIFFVSFVAAGMAVRFRNAAAETRFVPYTITWQAIDNESQSNVIAYTETKYTSADGRWVAVKTFPNGARQITFSQPGKGVFAVEKEGLQYLSASPLTPTTSNYFESPQYTRSEDISGYKAAVLTQNTDSGLRLEHYIAPELNNDSIKTVITNGQMVRSLEPVAIVQGEPPAAVFLQKDLPVLYEVYQQKQGSLQNNH